MKIFIDCDGVINDFGHSFYKFVAESSSSKYLKEINSISSYSLSDWFTCSSDISSKIIHDVFESFLFWNRLNPYEDVYTDLVSAFRDPELKDSLYIATTPANKVSLTCKADWFEKHFPFIPFDRIIYIKDKSLLADKDCYLIDDYYKNVNSFGDNGILFSQFYNKKDKVIRVADELSYALAYIKIKQKEEII
jgi:5'(3')-deoxyribonucleotidase